VRRVVLLTAALAVALALVAPASSLTRLPGFRSPTKNISCLFIPRPAPGWMLCQIKQAKYTKRLVAHCAAPPIGVDWGGFSLGPRKKASIVCTGGVLYDPSTQKATYVTLPYGQSWKHGVYTCSSKVTGVTCRNRTGHGLFLSRERYHLW
jgi:hypothetical protein